MSGVSNLSRRNFLTTSATVAGVAAASAVLPVSLAQANHDAASAKGLPEFIKWKDRSALVIHSSKTMETHRAAIGDGIVTPLRNVYIRNNLPSLNDKQIGDRKKWKVSISGVKNPKTFTLAQMQSMGTTTVATVLQCSGNGRGFFPHKPRGSQWLTGAAACLLWTGIPMQTLIDACGGISKGAKFMTSTGADASFTKLDPMIATVERSIPLKAYKDAILAWEVNGEPIPNAHGGPARTVTPGYFGINNVKHVSKVSFTKSESKVKYMKSSYRSSPIGKKGSQYPSCWEMPVKSWLTSHTDKTGRVNSGKVTLTGVAMGGTKKCSKVMVSVDGGKSWKKAKFVGPDLGKFAWRRFALSTSLKSGTYKVATKAYSGSKSQPELRSDNRRGYAHNGWKDHSVNLVVA